MKQQVKGNAMNIYENIDDKLLVRNSISLAYVGEHKSISMMGNIVPGKKVAIYFSSSPNDEHIVKIHDFNDDYIYAESDSDFPISRGSLVKFHLKFADTLLD